MEAKSRGKAAPKPSDDATRFQSLVDKIQIDQRFAAPVGAANNKILASISQRLSLHLSKHPSAERKKAETAASRMNAANISFSGDMRNGSFDGSPSNSGTNEFSFTETPQPQEQSLHTNPEEVDRFLLGTFGGNPPIQTFSNNARSNTEQQARDPAKPATQGVNRNLFVGGTLSNLCAIEVEEEYVDPRQLNAYEAPREGSSNTRDLFDMQFPGKVLNANTSGSFYEETSDNYVSQRRSKIGGRSGLSNSKLTHSIVTNFADDGLLKSHRALQGHRV